MTLPFDKYQLDFTQDCIFGQIGLSVSLDSLLMISNAIHNYCRVNKIEEVVLACDTSKWSTIFVSQVISPRLLELGMSCYLLDQPVPLWTLSWATNRVWIDSEKTIKPLGIYLSTDSSQEDILSIHFRDHNGAAFTENKVAQIVSQPIRIRESQEENYEADPPELLSVDRYPIYLKRTKLLNPDKINNSFLSIDNMFGASEPLIQMVRSEFIFQGQLVNKSSDSIRYIGYQSWPSGNWLEWKVPHRDNKIRLQKNLRIHAGINNDGRYLGIYDLKQNLEISTSGLATVFLRYLSEVKKKRGTVILSKALSDKVQKVAEYYKYKVVLVNSGPESLSQALEEVGLRSALFYCDEFGGFWFKGQVPEPNALISLLLLAEITEHYQMSPGELVDIVSKKVLKSNYMYGKLIVPEKFSTKHEIIDILKRDCPVETIQDGDTTVVRTEDLAKITLTQDRKIQSVFVTIESIDESVTRDIVLNLQEKCFGDLQDVNVEETAV